MPLSLSMLFLCLMPLYTQNPINLIDKTLNPMETLIQVKERPILFSTPMVAAILAGRKRQTRRTIKPQPVIDRDSGYVYHMQGKRSERVDIHTDWKKEWVRSFLPNKVGQRLWVRETWDYLEDFKDPKLSILLYRANYPDGKHPYGLHWRPSLFMPRTACRLVLEITDVRVERLQDISEGDAIAEGIDCNDAATGGDDYQDYYRDYSKPNDEALFPWIAGEPVQSFRTLWQSINGPESWQANPYVWVLTFKRVEEVLPC